MRLLTWNLNGRRHVEKQLAAIVGRSPDIIALQEVTQRSIVLWRAALPAVGLFHVIDSFATSVPWAAVGSRRYGVVIASRFPLTHATSSHVVPWPERILSAEVALPAGPVRVHTTHIPPGSSNGWKKVEMLEAVSAVVSAREDVPCILCGDFNVPQAETAEGRIVTWAERVMINGEPRVRARLRGGDGHRWDEAERVVMQGGMRRDLIDVYRHLHGYGRREFSWFLKRGGDRIGRRFDHTFCSRNLVLNRCEYLQKVREDRLSDHAALELDFEL
jgi:exonuclease III